MCDVNGWPGVAEAPCSSNRRKKKNGQQGCSQQGGYGFLVDAEKRVHAGLRVRAEISSQIFSVEAPGWQGAKVQEYQAYSELSQHSQAERSGD